MSLPHESTVDVAIAGAGLAGGSLALSLARRGVSVALIDPRSDKVVGSVAVGVRPSGIAAGEGSVWVANLDDRTLSQIDPETQALRHTISPGTTPTGLLRELAG